MNFIRYTAGIPKAFEMFHRILIVEFSTLNLDNFIRPIKIYEVANREYRDNVRAKSYSSFVKILLFLHDTIKYLL